MDALTLIGALSLGLSLRVDSPADAPTMAGFEADLRYHLLNDAFVGFALGWGGGANETNPNRTLISQRIEAVAVLGGFLPLSPQVKIVLEGRAGMARLEGWPRGFLPSTRQFSPTVGAEVGAAFALSPRWDIEPRVGAAWVRVGDADRAILGGILAVRYHWLSD